MKLLKLYEGILNDSQGQHCVAEIEHLLTNNKSKRPEFIDGIKALKKCISLHPEIIHPEGAAYRGINMSLKDLLDQYEDITDDLKKGGEFHLSYKSKDPIQGWSVDRHDVEKSALVSPYLTLHINNFKAGKGNIKDLFKNLNDITVPVIIKMEGSSDDFLLKGDYFKYLSNDKDDLFRVNNQPKRVTGRIIEPIFDTVYMMLKAIKNHKVDKSK